MRIVADARHSGPQDVAREAAAQKTMEFHIEVREVRPDLPAINATIAAIDPAAVADIDATGATLRIATMIESPELIELLAQAGFPVAPRQLTQLPSICCGGCGG